MKRFIFTLLTFLIAAVPAYSTTTMSVEVTAGNKYASSAIKGIVIAQVGTYTASGSESAADTVQMVMVPKGAQIIEVKLMADNGTATTNINVGDGSDTDRYLMDVQADAAFAIGMDGAKGGTAGAGYAYTADDTVDMLLDTAGLTATHVYKMTVVYVMTN